PPVHARRDGRTSGTDPLPPGPRRKRPGLPQGLRPPRQPRRRRTHRRAPEGTGRVHPHRPMTHTRKDHHPMNAPTPTITDRDHREDDNTLDALHGDSEPQGEQATAGTPAPAREAPPQNHPKTDTGAG